MPDLKLQQLHFETEALKRLLTFMMDENVYLKNRIAEILKNTFESTTLGKIEIFQNRFIMEDELVGLLRNDVAELDKLLRVQELIPDKAVIEDLSKKIRKLSYNMENTEGQFMRLKAEFNSFLLDSISAAEKTVMI